mmetsp:Transcript_104455/g.248513  ORF Transcript_104455/g.248513 Transcript_104455/m.248513 type:complete len:276 (+) Transcript_104455:75-902(+)
MVFSTSVQPWEDSEWPQAFATSNWMRPSFYLVFRGIWAALFLGHFIAHVVEYAVNQDEGWFYIMYLTRLALILETLSELLLFALAVWGYFCLSKFGGKLPLLVRIEVVLWSTVYPVCVIVTVLYFFLINPIWNYQWKGYLIFFVHLINTVLLLIGFFASRVPFSFKSVGWSWSLGFAYAAWTLIHFYAKIGGPVPCADYPQNECPIYNAFDWHNPTVPAIITASLLLVVIPLLNGMFVALASCRDSRDKGSKRNWTPDQEMKDVNDKVASECERG